MGTITGVDQKTLSLQIRFLMVSYFLDEYNRLEKAIRSIFEVNIDTLPSNIKQQLYFYYGGKIGTYIEYESQEVKIREMKYKKTERFSDFSIKQIIKIFEKNKCLDAFEFSIESIKKSTMVFPFYDCMVRLVNMRNKLAHEVTNLSFKDADLVELLSPEQISQEPFGLFQNYDLSKMDEVTQYIGSNIIYIRRIISQLPIIQ